MPDTNIILLGLSDSDNPLLFFILVKYLKSSTQETIYYNKCHFLIQIFKWFNIILFIKLVVENPIAMDYSDSKGSLFFLYGKGITSYIGNTF